MQPALEVERAAGRRAGVRGRVQPFRRQPASQQRAQRPELAARLLQPRSRLPFERAEHLVELVHQGVDPRVMLLFLGPRTGLVVASLVPLAMIASLLVMSFLDVGLDQMSLAALIIALGMLVDNAIVMTESIMVQMATGRRPVEAAVSSARELRVPLLVSSLTTAAAFLPISLAQSTTGEYTSPLFKVITIALLSSWLLVLTMTPLLCVLFLKVRPVAAGE